MESDGKKDGFSQDLDELIEEYGSVKGVVNERYDEIRNAQKKRVPLERIVEKINNRFGLEATVGTLSSYLSVVKKERESKHEAEKPSSPTVDPKVVSSPKSSKSKTPTKPKPRKKPVIPNNEECPYIQKIEELLGERLPDSVRPFVEIKNGGLITHFERGTIHSAEIREFTTRIRRLCDRNLI